jgi:hypothetical protein
MLEVQNAYYPAMKGLIVAVVRGSDKVERATKAIRTMMARYGIGRENLEQAFAEVDTESVQPFLAKAPSSPYYQPERFERSRPSSPRSWSDSALRHVADPLAGSLAHLVYAPPSCYHGRV